MANKLVQAEWGFHDGNIREEHAKHWKPGEIKEVSDRTLAMLRQSDPDNFTVVGVPRSTKKPKKDEE